MIYLIYAYEERYGGEHGMNLWDICDVDSVREAQETGREMSIEVMESYSSIGEDLLEEAREEAEIYGYEEDSLDFENILDELYKENMAYEIYRLSDEYTVEQYYEMMRTLDWEEIRDKYGID